MKNIKIYVSILALVLFASCNNKSSGNAKTITNEVKNDSIQSLAAVYQCPMDCEKGKTYNKPGKCPVCGMDLEKK